MTPEQQAEMIGKIKSAGIVGAGGAGFPTHVKIAGSAECLIVNGAECEPLLQVDQQLIQLYTSELISAIEMLIEVTGAAKAVFVTKKKYKKAWEALEHAKKDPRIELFSLDDFYPAGDEHVLVYEVLRNVVPQGGIPLKVGCIVSNVETLFNISRAMEDLPVIDKYVCITGAVDAPVTLKLPLGISFRDALSLAGITLTDDMSIIEGGPFMGKIRTDLDAPVTKTTKGLLVLPTNHKLIQNKLMPMSKMMKRARSVCLQCMRCTDVCPRALLGHRIQPHKIMRSIGYKINDHDILSGALACSECGLCETACLMNLSPRTINASLKAEFAKAGIRPQVIEIQGVSPVRESRKLPSQRLVAKLGLSRYQRPAPLQDTQFEPKIVKIPLKQHLGAPASAVVEVGQKVQRGEVLGEIPEGALGARVHASISGIIKEITEQITIWSE